MVFFGGNYEGKVFVCQSRRGGFDSPVLKHNKNFVRTDSETKVITVVVSKQERRFRLAVTTFPVFVKRTKWILYKPPIYARYFIIVSIRTNLNLSQKFGS